MILKKIYANGFKSFAEKTEIIVEKGITAIVGPNGSGKSNISDAIKWVLGEQSAKSLRGGKMDDVIFSGTEKRMALGYAEVNLIFDNQSGIIPIDYQEVSIKRKLYRTGESEYYINKQQCRLKDVKELFMDTGIGRDGYSFIGQGRVEDILSPNSEVRRQVFEEAAGIVKYKTRKEESERKLEKTNENLDRVEDIIHELGERIEPLKEQSQKAIQYIDLKNNLKNYELNYYVQEYEKHREQLTLLKNQRNTTLEEKINLQKKRDILQETIVSEKEKINHLQSKINTLETEKSSKDKEYENYQSLSKIHSEKRLLYKSNIKNVEKEIEEIEKRNEELNLNIENLKSEKSVLFNNLKNMEDEHNSMNSEINEYKLEIDNVIKLIEDKKNDLFELHKEINKLNSTRSTFDSFLKNDNERIEQLSKEIEEEEKEKLNKEEIINILRKEEEETKEDLSSKKEELNTAVTEHDKVENEKKFLEDNIKKVNNELLNTNSKLNILSNMDAYYDGYYKSVKTLMNNKEKNNNLNKSILGTVADIISTKKEYETAIEVALGSAIQNVIVNSEVEAGNIIEYLKNNKIGRVTFLPIEMLQARGLNEHEKYVLSDPSVINTGDMLVETNSKFEKVIKHLLGRILIVDNLNNGFKISKRLGNTVKIVSLQGDVINAGGSVTGGHISNNQNLLGRKREITELKDLKEKYTEELKIKNKELISLANKINSYDEKIDNIKSIINEKTNSIKMSQSKILMLEEQTDKSSAAIQKYIKEKSYMEEEREKHSEELKKLQEQIEEYKSLIDEKEISIKEIVALNEDNKVKYDEFNKVLSKQRDEVSQIKQDIKLFEEKENNILSEIERNTNSKKTKEINLQSINSEIDVASNLIEEYTAKNEELKKELDNLNEILKNDKENLSTLQNEIYEYQNKINDTNKNLTQTLDDENSMNVKIEREQSRIEDISTKLWEEYEMNYGMALKYKDETISQSKLYNEVNSLKKTLRSLGNINVDSIEEYKEVKKRFDFLTLQQKDLMDAKNQLQDVIKELEVKMRDKFIEEFSNIRLKFNNVFKKLFNGGSGDVYLEDESDALNSNIEIAVQPPGKKLSKITLLSGGEKALTAIALLFAILQTKPTPFCILDEIEAALDDANIYRFAQYLKDFSKETQFIVITHRKGTMEYADTLYGVTMEEKGVTKLVSLKLSDVTNE